MEDTVNRHKSGEWRCGNARLVRRKNQAENCYAKEAHTNEKDEVKEYCQFVEDEIMGDLGETCGASGDTLRGSPQSIWQKNREDNIYKGIVTTLNLVEGTPEHKIYFQNNVSYNTQYSNLRRDKDRYEKEKKWCKIRTAAGRGDQTREQKNVIKTPAKEPPEIERGRSGSLKHHVVKDDKLSYLEVNMRKVEKMLWTSSRYFTPLIVNDEPVKACILDVNGRSNTMPMSWAKILNIEGIFHATEGIRDEGKKAGTIDYARDVTVQIGRAKIYTEFEIIEDEDMHNGFITLGRDFLEEVNAILDIRKGIMTLRSISGYGKRQLQIRRRPMIFIYGEWVNLGLMEFYYNIMMTTVTLPDKPIEEEYEIVGRKILELLDEYDSRKVRLKETNFKDVMDNHAGKPFEKMHSPNEPDRKEDKNGNINGDVMPLFTDEELNYMRQCPDSDAPSWEEIVSLDRTVLRDEERDNLYV